MKPSHIVLLICIAALWGFNFVAIRVGLDHVPPITFSAMRFIAVFFPAVLFVKKPNLPWSKIAAYGVVMFVGQFSFLFTAMHVGLSTGLASLLLQMQAFFTIGFAVLFLKEKAAFYQFLGALIAATGLILVGTHAGGEVTGAGILLVLCGAASWGGGNVLTKTFGKVDMFGVIIWSSVFAFPLLLGLAFLMEGKDAVIGGFTNMGASTLAALAYIAYVSTLVGFTTWSRMLGHYPAAMVAPFTLLVPAFGMLGAAWFLGEAYPLWKFEATLLIITGLCVNQFGGRFVNFIRRKKFGE
ncbi:MAG TPA: EamA family transporter [Alphaproteobacteria bacterium]|nr:EamA family transporter [Alphaproteobacteria bacterium]